MYRLTHTNVDGAGLVGEFANSGVAAREADRLQRVADGRGNPYLYTYHVRNQRGNELYSTVSRAIDHNTANDEAIQRVRHCF